MNASVGPGTRVEWPQARMGTVDTGTVDTGTVDTGSTAAGGVRLAYLEVGPADGPLVVCLHGFPDTPLTFRRLGGVLAENGFRVVAPRQRGYPPSEVVTGPYQVAALARDALAVARALSPEAPVSLVGHDWGALASYGAAVLGPDVVMRIVTLSVPPSNCFRPFLRTSWEQQRASWYQFLFQMEPLAENVVGADGFAFIERLWRSWSPGWEPDGDLLAATVASIEAGFPASLLYYRDTWQPSRQHPDLATDQQAIFDGPVTVPALVLHGAQDGCIFPGAFAGIEGYFTGGLRRQTVIDAGHFLHLERPDAVRDLVLDALGKG